MVYFISFATLIGLEELLADTFGLKLELLLADTDYSTDDLKGPIRKISLDFVCELLELCSQRTNCDHFALLLADKQSLQTQGLMGLVADYSGTLEDAISNMVDIVHFNSAGAVQWSTRKYQGLVELSVQLAPQYLGVKAQANYLSLAKAVKYLRKVSNNNWIPETVYFSCSEPKDKTALRKVFGDDIRFDWDYCGVTFDEKFLALPLPHDDPRIIELVKNYLMLSGETVEEDVVKKTKKMLRSAMLFEQPIHLEAIASKQSKHPRTLQNHLKRLKTSFQILLDQVRFEVACDLLMNGQQSISSISLLVGYSDCSVFSRAFKIHTGQSPLRYRQSHQS